MSFGAMTIGVNQMNTKLVFDSKKISVEQMAELVERLCALGVYKDGKISVIKVWTKKYKKYLMNFLVYK